MPILLATPSVGASATDYLECATQGQIQGAVDFVKGLPEANSAPRAACDPDTLLSGNGLGCQTWSTPNTDEYYAHGVTCLLYTGGPGDPEVLYSCSVTNHRASDGSWRTVEQPPGCQDA